MPDPTTCSLPAPPARTLLPALALAHAGAVATYLPLLTLLLPMRVEELAGDARVAVLTACTEAGGVAASVANIGLGWLSDRAVAMGGGRRRGLGYGIAAVLLAYAPLAVARSAGALVATIVLFQVAVNAVLAPLTAMIAEEAPDADKGLTGGLLALGVPFAALLGAAVMDAPLSTAGRLAALALAAATAIAPILRTRPPPRSAGPDRQAPGPRRDLWIAWAARLLVQVAGNVLFGYLLYYLEGAVPEVGHAALARRAGPLITLAYALPVPAALLLGRWSDRMRRRKPALLAAAAIATAGLVGMAAAHGWTEAAGAFGVFALGWGVFMPLQATYAMQLLPDPAWRGRDLGIVNLANTAPALIGPALVWSLADRGDFDLLLLVLAATTAAGGLLTLAVRTRA